jgi:protein-tyrosine-phosphatase
LLRAELLCVSARPYNALFLCTGNSARSILAECLLRELGKGTFQAYSAGSVPKGAVHPLVLRLLNELDFSTEHLRSKSWDEFAAPGVPVMDFVFTVCDQVAGEVCPVWPGDPVMAHWGIPDPAAAGGCEAARMLACRHAFHMLERRIRLFVALPIAGIDRMALQRRVDAIGYLRPDTTEDRAS